MEVDNSLVGCIEISILKAAGLSRVNLISKPSTFVTLTFDGQMIGKTDIVSKSVDPVWNSKFVVNIPEGKDISICSLELYVFHMKPDQNTQCLGYRKITGSEMLYLSTIGDNDDEVKEDLEENEENSDGDGDDDARSVKVASAPFELRTEPIPGQKQKPAKGNIYLFGHFHPHPPPVLLSPCGDDEDSESETEGSIKSLQAYLTLQVQIMQARDIANANTKGSIAGSSNPFGIIKINGTELYRTPVIGNTLTPHWHNETIQIRIPVDFDIMKSTFEYEMWHSNNPRRRKRSKFLGTMYLRSDEFCKFAGCVVRDVITMQEEVCKVMRSYYDGAEELSLWALVPRSRPSSPEDVGAPVPVNDEVELSEVGRPTQEYIRRNATMQPRQNSATMSTTSGDHPSSMKRSALTSVVDIYDKGMPLWIKLVPSVQRTAPENALVQGDVKMCFNFKLPPDRATALKGLEPGFASHRVEGFELVHPKLPIETKKQPTIVVNVMAIRGQIFKEALKLKQEVTAESEETISITRQDSDGSSVEPSSIKPAISKTLAMQKLEEYAVDPTKPPQMFCVIRDMFGEAIGKTLPLVEPFSLRWQEERFWLPFPFKHHELFPVLFSVEVYCIAGTGRVESLGVTSVSAESVLEVISEGQSVLGTPGGLGPYEEFKSGTGVRWFDLDAPYFSDDEDGDEGGGFLEEDGDANGENEAGDGLAKLTSSPNVRMIKKQISSSNTLGRSSCSRRFSRGHSQSVLHRELGDRRMAIAGIGSRKIGPLGSVEIKIQARSPLDLTALTDDELLRRQESDDDEEDAAVDDELFSLHSETDDSGVLTLKLGEVTGMGLVKSKRQIFGKKISKVFCNVWANGVFVGQTSTIKLTAESRWDESFNILLPGSMQLDQCHIEIEMFKETPTKMTASNPRGVLTYSAGVIELRAEELHRIIDHEKSREDVKDKADAAEEGAEEDSASHDLHFTLAESCRNFSIDEKPNQIIGMIGISGSFEAPHSIERLAFISQDEDEHMDRELKYTPALLELSIYEAANLANADMFGMSDPFVIVIWNDEESGRTYVINDSLNPVWVDQVFQLPVPRYKDVLSCKLELHVYDDNTVGKNHFLGCHTLSGNSLQKLLSKNSDNDTSPAWLDLKPSKFMSKKQNKLVQGSLLVQCRYTESHRDLRRWSVDHVKIETFLFAGEDLSKIENRRKPNVFVVVFWNNSEIGRSSVVRKAVNPQWDISDESCRFTIYFPEDKAGQISKMDMEIAVYHSDLGKETELLQNCLCLGRASLRGFTLHDLLEASKKRQGPAEITPLRLPVESFTRGSTVCRADTFNKTTPQGMLDIGIIINDSENHQQQDIENEKGPDSTEISVVSMDYLADLPSDKKKVISRSNTRNTMGTTFGMTEASAMEDDEFDANQFALTTTVLDPNIKRSTHKMHFHQESGSYYYVDELSQESSWDRPTDGAVELYYSPEHIEAIRETRSTLRQKKIDELNALKAAVRIIRCEHDEENKRLAHEKRRKEEKVIYLAWQKALSIAAEETGECNISWQKCTGIDKMVYEFEETFKKPLKAVRLVGVQLSILPDEFCLRLYGIQVLSLANNDLTSLPECLYKMYNLRHLNVMNNKLTSLPAKIGLMATNLSRLEISNNKLKSLPATFAALVKITRVDLENNCIERLPENLDLMYNCEVLNVSCNQLTRLPRCIGRMKGLKTLSANRNQITYIPLEVCKSKSLEVLRLCTNKLSALPENIGQMKNLRELFVDHNFITFLPVTFCHLTNLKLLRIEENRSLEAPDQDILGAGAQAVVQWSYKRYMEDGAWRRKRIIVTLQDCLEQMAQLKTYDLSQFEPSNKIHDDMWYALDLKYFWNVILPELQKKWKKMIDNYDSLPKNMVLSFPYSKKDVMWALRSFQDAYGYVYKVSYANFRRCACVDENGKRRPCVPPIKGFMCRRKCALIKHQAVLEHEKELRLWRAHVKFEIDDAVKRAEKEALKFLESIDGKLWIAEMSFERAEEAMHGKGISHAMNWREKLAETRKQNIIKKYDRKKKKVLKKRDGNSSALLIEIEELKLEAKQAKEGGYAKQSANEKLAAAYEELANLPENEMLKELQAQCERECEAVEDDLLYTDSSSEEDNYQRESYMDRKRREAAEANQAAIDAVAGSAMIPEMPPSPPRSSIITNMIFSALDVVPPKDRREVLLRRHKRRAKRFLRNTFDMVNMRVTKMRLMAGGDFKEMQQELEHETYVQYIGNAAAVARRRAERDFYVLGRIRNQWKGLGMELCFREWKKWVRQKTRRQRADLRKTYRLEKKQYEADLITYHLAKAQVSLWVKQTDVYSDIPCWKNWQSGDMTWQEPLVEDYMPAGCGIPKKPTPLPIGMGEDTSSSSEDEYFRPRVRDDVSTAKSNTGDGSQSVPLLKDGDGDEDPDESQTDDASSELTEDQNLVEGGDMDSLDSRERSVQERAALNVANSTTSGGHQRARAKPVDPNDYSKQRWDPLVSSSLDSNSLRLPTIGSQYLLMNSLSASGVASLSRTHSGLQIGGSTNNPMLQLTQGPTSSLAVTRANTSRSLSRTGNNIQAMVPSSSTGDMMQLVPGGGFDDRSRTNALTTYKLQGPGEKVILPAYAYGPDSLRAGRLQGRVGRPLFPDPKVLVDDDDDNTIISTEEAALLLDSYSKSDESKASSYQLQLKVATELNLKEKSKEERNRALEEVKQRRDIIKRVRNRTYLKQRDRRPRAAQDIQEDRRRREAKLAEFKRPTTPELLQMVNGNPDDVWKSSDIGKRTVLATKALALQKKLKAKAVADGLIPDHKPSLFESSIKPLWDDDYTEASDPYHKL